MELHITHTHTHTHTHTLLNAPYKLSKLEKKRKKKRIFFLKIANCHLKLTNQTCSLSPSRRVRGRPPLAQNSERTSTD